MINILPPSLATCGFHVDDAEIALQDGTAITDTELSTKLPTTPAPAMQRAGCWRKDPSPQREKAWRKSGRLAANTLTAITAFSLVYPGSLLINFLSFSTF